MPRARAAGAKRSRVRAESPRPPSHDDIARSAYDRFLREGAQHGRDVDHWLAAERELLARQSGDRP